MESVNLIQELSDQELAGAAGEQAGGIWTVPGTFTIGRVCTASWECWGFLCWA